MCLGDGSPPLEKKMTFFLDAQPMPKYIILHMSVIVITFDVTYTALLNLTKWIYKKKTIFITTQCGTGEKERPKS